MIRWLIAYLDSKLKISFEHEDVVQESVELTPDELYDILLSMNGMTENLADQIIETINEMMR